MGVEKVDRRKPWVAYWRNPLTKKVERKSFDTEAEARHFDDLMKVRIKHQPDTFAGEPGPDDDEKDTYVSGIIYSHLKSLGLSPRNFQFTENHLNPVWKVLNNVKASELSIKHMKALVSYLKGKGIKQNTIIRKVSIIKAAMAWAVAEEIIQADPISSFKCPRGEDKKVPPPTPGEIRALLAVADGHVKRVILISFYMGVRVGESELLRMTWSDFDFEREVCRVRAAAKNPKRPWREVDISPILLPYLLQWSEEDSAQGIPWVIHYNGGPLRNFRRAWKSAKAAAGITRDMEPYSLRHAFATYALASGNTDMVTLADLMGHSSPAMILKHYGHVLNTRKRQAVESLPDVGKSVGQTCRAGGEDFVGKTDDFGALQRKDLQ